MITPLHLSTRRIILVLVLSTLLHALILWQPYIKLAPHEEKLPPLIAKLEPLPNIKPPPAPRKRSKPKAATAPAQPSNTLAPVPASAVPASVTIAASAPEITEVITPVTEAPQPLPISKQTLFPLHAQLVFSVRKGADGLHLGEVQHNLDIIDRRYTVQASTQTTGLARWFKSYNLNQNSHGTVTDKGLRPDIFSEEKTDSGNAETLSATFVWDRNLLYFSQGGEAPLVEGAQDTLSILYQLGLLDLSSGDLTVTISNGKKLEIYPLEIVTNEMLITPMGNLHTVHLRKIRQPNKAGLEIWLAKEYRLLPVQVQYIEPDGSIAASIIITDIRVSDE